MRQTRFFAAAFREFERRCARIGAASTSTRCASSCSPSRRRAVAPCIVAVRDRAGDRYGLHPVDWDLLARIPGLERLDVVVTDTTLAGAFHERIHQWLPGIEETRWEPAEPAAGCQLPAASLHIARDREEEVVAFARWVRAEAGEAGSPALDRMAIVVRQRLPYVYLAREVFRSAGVPCQMFDALPLAAEPYAAALDLRVFIRQRELCAGACSIPAALAVFQDRRRGRSADSRR